MKLFEHLLVNAGERATFFVIVQVERPDFVDNLPQQHAVFHIVVRVGEDGANDRLLRRRRRVDREVFQRREKFVVHEVEEFVAGEPFAGFIVAPRAPTTVFRNDRDVIFVFEFPVRFLGVVRFQKERPDDLLDPLRVAVDAGIVAHNIAKFFHKTG